MNNEYETLKKEIENLKKSNQSPEENVKKYNAPGRLIQTSVKYVYLIREREFCRLNEDIYKIGKSSEVGYKRLGKYPKWSEIISIMEVSDEDKIEGIIIDKFKETFLITKYGREYFQGNRQDIKNEFAKIVFENDWKISI